MSVLSAGVFDRLSGRISILLLGILFAFVVIQDRFFGPQINLALR